MKSVSSMMAEINRLQGQIAAIEAAKTQKNIGKLVEEVQNLLDCVGGGYIEEDYYAPTRYYSEIDGVKNLRIRRYDEDPILDELSGRSVIYAKVVSPQGYLLPDEVEIRGIKYLVRIIESDGYSERIDY